MIKNELKSLVREVLDESRGLSEAMAHHVRSGVGFDNCIYRPGSEAYFSLIREARSYFKSGLYVPKSKDELELLEYLDVGEFDVYRGEKVPLDFPFLIEPLDEAKYQGREVELGKKGATRIGGGRARVYVRDPDTGKVKKVEFGSAMSDAMGDSDKDKKRRKNYGDRHNCADKDDKTKPGYWSCRATKLFGRKIPGWW